MARPPRPEGELLERFGPHLSYAPPGGWAEQASRPPDRLVKTHCCFCGLQCGIQLKVRDNQVVGFEPWDCLLYTSPSPRDLSTSRMPSSA